MNKHIALIGALLCATLFGAADDMVLSFSTPGVDRYADGRRVKDGESYALVWTAEGATFGGLKSDCEPVAETDRIVMVAPLAKGGKCPVTVLEIAASEADQYKKGEFSLYLLDTRTKGADGKVTLASYVNGRPRVVNSFGLSDADGSGIDAGEVIAGSIVGASAVCGDTELQITARKGVILASGGISEDEKLLKAVCPEALRADKNEYYPKGGNSGAALRMALRAGAAATRSGAAPVIHPVNFTALGPGIQTSWLMVDKFGKRFCCEMGWEPLVTNARLNAPGNVAWMVWDSRYRAHLLRQEPVSMPSSSEKTITG